MELETSKENVFVVKLEKWTFFAVVNSVLGDMNFFAKYFHG